MTVIYLVRHGDRFDYFEKDRWEQTCVRHGLEVRDPPLSRLGHAQAREAAGELMRLTGGKVDKVLCSPYIRVLQTAQPFAHASGMDICVEEGLSETSHVPNSLPPVADRFRFVPEIDTAYTSKLRVIGTATDPRSGRHVESNPFDYLVRMRLMAAIVEQTYQDQTVVCFSHAASVALVAALTRRTLEEAGKLAPCGIYKLVSNASGGWNAELRDTSSYISENGATRPWGFVNSRLYEQAEERWVHFIRDRSVEELRAVRKAQQHRNALRLRASCLPCMPRLGKRGSAVDQDELAYLDADTAHGHKAYDA